MRNLIEVNGWVVETNDYPGKYINERGKGLTGFYRMDYKKTCDMLVLNNGYKACKYKYPRVAITFKHSMVSWYNLAFCNGYHLTKRNGKTVDDIDIIKAVVKGTKPIGFAILKKAELDAIVDRVKQSGLPFVVLPHHWPDYVELGVSNRGTIGQNFDLENLIQSYRVLSNAFQPGYSMLSEQEELVLRGLADRELSSFLVGYDYANPRNGLDLAITGLILGYAVESTFACATGYVN